MDSGVRGALVTGHQSLIAGLSLPDPNDRHVLAAAIHSGATHIVTLDHRHFPTSQLAGYEIEAIDPDRFVVMLHAFDAQAVVEAARAHRRDLRNPPRTVEEYLDALDDAGLTATALLLRKFAPAL